MIDNPFRRFAALGYTRLCPVIPPDAELGECTKVSLKSRGKAPGTRGRDGRWYGFNFVAAPDPDAADLDRWHAMKAGVGIKTGAMPDGTWLIGVDADTIDEALSRQVGVAMTALDIEGNEHWLAPMRVGKAPKALYVVRVSGPLAYHRVDFGPKRPPERVELLSEGRQFVAHGLHPDTGRPYEWVVPLVPYADLPVFAPEDLL